MYKLNHDQIHIYVKNATHTRKYDERKQKETYPVNIGGSAGDDDSFAGNVFGEKE